MSKEQQIEIWLADFAHKGNMWSTFPLGIACVTSYSKMIFGDFFKFRLFRSVDKFAEEFVKENRPIFLGLSNTVMNARLSYAVVRRVKNLQPRSIVITGGVNYPKKSHLQLKYLEENQLIDFHIWGEGEQGFVNLLNQLKILNFNADELKFLKVQIEGCHYLSNGELISGGISPRLNSADLNNTPSPYLTGLLDDFFKEGLEPLVQGVRGCPFTCTYCEEGDDYYRKINRFSVKRFEEELYYIVQRLESKELTLHIADSNFGMYSNDFELFRVISEIQEKYGWPKKIETAIGKNREDNILNAIGQLSLGTIWHGAALQSANPEVLKSIRRKNISTEKLLITAKKSTESGRGSFSELILGLPCESKESHLSSVKTVIDAGITRIRIYTLLLLRGTELEFPESRERFRLKTRHKILHRNFGHYKFDKEVFVCAEIGEHVVENSTMSFEDYVCCRLFDLTVEFFYNDEYFVEIKGLLNILNISMFDFVFKCYELLPTYPSDLKSIYDKLEASIRNEFECLNDIELFIEGNSSIDEYSKNEHENGLATNRAIGILTYAEAIHMVAEDALNRLLDERGLKNRDLRSYVDEMFMFSRYRKNELLNTEIVFEGRFTFDFIHLQQIDFKENPLNFLLPQKQVLKFFQKQNIADEIKERYYAYEDQILGMRNVLYYSFAASPVNYYFRSFKRG